MSTIDTLDVFDRLWVPSRANALAFVARGNVTPFAARSVAKVIPHAFHEESLAHRADSTDRSAAPFRFYYIGAWTRRKNPLGILRAYANAFSPMDDVELYFYCAGLAAETFVPEIASTGIDPKEMPRVRLQNETVTDAHMNEVHRHGDCFVSATRGEAWNLPAFDAMLAGRNIICPGGMGSDDFLVDTSASLYGGMAVPAMVDVTLTGPVKDGQAPMRVQFAHGLNAKAKWLEPDLMRLAECMRNAYDFRRRDLTIKYDPIQRYGYAAVGKIALAALTEVVK